MISPNEMHSLNTVIIAPMTTKGKNYPTRISIHFSKKDGFVVLDQIRTVDKSRRVQFLGTVNKQTALKILKVLQEIFS